MFHEVRTNILEVKGKTESNQNFKNSLNGFNSRTEVTEERVRLISVNLEDRFIEVVQSEQQGKNLKK